MIVGDTNGAKRDTIRDHDCGTSVAEGVPRSWYNSNRSFILEAAMTSTQYGYVTSVVFAVGAGHLW